MATEELPDPGTGAPPAKRADRAHAGTRVARRLGSATRRAGQRLRSTTVRAARWLVVHAFVAALSVGAGLLVVALAAEYGYHPVRNTATWASQPFGYAIAGACVQCHDSARSAIALGGHERVSCEACHGPQEGHVLAQQAAAGTLAPGSPAASGTPAGGGPALAVSLGPELGSSASCLACHEAVLGRPRAFPMISPATHFGTAACVLCHDPHATTALAPPIVRHDLANLPDCLTCHGAGRIRAMPEKHPIVTGLDCLACHLRRTE